MVSGSSREESVATVGSGSITLPKLDALLSNVDAGKPTFIVCNSTQHTNIMNAIRAEGSLPSFSTEENLGAGPVLRYNGVPVFRNDFIIADTKDTLTASSRIYAVYASEIDGITGFFNGSNVFDVSAPIEVNQSDMVEYKVVFRAGLSMKSSHAVYAIRGCL